MAALGGLLSSGSSIASAATLVAHGEVPVLTGVNGNVLSSAVSILINIPLVAGMGTDRVFKRSLALGLAAIAGAGVAGAVIKHLF